MNEKLLKTRAALREFDQRLTVRRQQAVREGTPIVATCGKGCFACCREPLQTSRTEAELVFASIPEDEKSGVRERTIKWLDRILNAGGLAMQDMPLVHDWRPLMAWCPILKDGNCLTYANRPIGCRSHMAVGPRENCEDDDLRYFQQYVNTPELTAYIVGKMARLDTDGIEMTHLPAWLALFFGLITMEELTNSFFVRREEPI